RAVLVFERERNDVVQALSHVIVKRNGAKVVQLDLDSFTCELLKILEELCLGRIVRAIQDYVNLNAGHHCSYEISRNSIFRSDSFDGAGDFRAGIQLPNDVVLGAFGKATLFEALYHNSKDQGFQKYEGVVERGRFRRRDQDADIGSSEEIENVFA